MFSFHLDSLGDAVDQRERGVEKERFRALLGRMESRRRTSIKVGGEALTPCDSELVYLMVFRAGE